MDEFQNTESPFFFSHRQADVADKFTELVQFLETNPTASAAECKSDDLVFRF